MCNAFDVIRPATFFESIFPNCNSNRNGKKNEALAGQQNKDLDLYLAKEKKIGSPVILDHVLNWTSGSIIL